MTNTTERVQLRLWAQLRRTAVLDAITYELIRRNNSRIAKGLPPIGKLGVSSRLERPWLARAMENARDVEGKMLGVIL